jgi:oligopeptide/dipeptide ABC transporter ATP-binding protein
MKDVEVTFDTSRGTVEAVNDLSLSLQRGEILCMVGESGSGKSVTAETIVDLVPQPPAEISGEIWFDNDELRSSDDAEMRDLRGDRIGFIFQDPMSSLNPVHSVGRQITEAVRSHNNYDDAETRSRTIELMNRVGIPDAEQRYSDYPFEFSGGMRQRVMIAIALANEPDLLIADEPTTALDVTIEAQILELVRELSNELDMGVLWITHDFGVVAEIADRVAVMYAGSVVERGDVYKIFEDAKHPYTLGLMNSIPGALSGSETLDPIEGEPPDQTALPDGCRFRDRCPQAMPHCADRMPPAYLISEDGQDRHEVACYLYDDQPVAEQSGNDHNE